MQRTLLAIAFALSTLFAFVTVASAQDTPDTTVVDETPNKEELGKTVPNDESAKVVFTNKKGCRKVRNGHTMWCSPCSNRICTIRIRKKRVGSSIKVEGPEGE